MAVAEIDNLHAAYIRLTERFKALWTFHQFLKGVHQTFLGDVPPYTIEFNGIYDRLREVSADASSASPSGDARDRLDRIETELSLAARTLRLSDRSLSPSLVRRFFDKIKPQDPKIVYHLLRFYFAQPDLDADTADKVDFLATLATARADTEDLPRERDDAVALFEAIVSGCAWPKVPDEEAGALVAALDELAGDVSHARSFEDLVREKRIENIRTIKRRLGFALADPRVLGSIGIANVRTRAVFRRFFAEEKKRIEEASERIESIEREIAHAGPPPEEFRHFRRAREEFDRLQEEANVRAGDLLALKHRIAAVLGKFDLRALEAEEIDDALEIEDGDAPEGSAAPQPPALRQAVEKVLAAVEMGDGSLGDITNLGLESWELRAAKRAIAGGGVPISSRDSLLVEGAAIRVRADDQSGEWVRSRKMGRSLQILRASAGETLELAAETDRRFAELIGEAGEDSLPEEMKSMVRSRFRLLHSYTRLWLLHDSAD